MSKKIYIGFVEKDSGYANVADVVVNVPNPFQSVADVINTKTTTEANKQISLAQLSLQKRQEQDTTVATNQANYLTTGATIAVGYEQAQAQAQAAKAQAQSKNIITIALIGGAIIILTVTAIFIMKTRKTA